MSIQSAEFVSDLQIAEDLLTKWESWCPALLSAICKIHALKSRAMGREEKKEIGMKVSCSGLQHSTVRGFKRNKARHPECPKDAGCPHVFRCPKISNGYKCTRKQGHAGNHHAHGCGECFEVWE